MGQPNSTPIIDVAMYVTGATLYVTGTEFGEFHLDAPMRSFKSALFDPNPTIAKISDHGPDVYFYVSGTRGLYNASARRAIYEGDVHVSGTVAVGSGSVKVTSNDVQFSSMTIRIEKNGNDLKFYDGLNPAGMTLSQMIHSGSDLEAQYVVMQSTGSLANERVLAAGTGMILTDGGGGGNATFSINNNVVATVSGTTFSNTVYTDRLNVSGTMTVAGTTVCAKPIYANSDVNVSGTLNLGGQVSSTGAMFISGTVVSRRSVRFVNASYTVVPSDDLIICRNLTGHVTMTLGGSVATMGNTYTFKDVSGSAGTYNIVLSGSTANIDGGSTATISTPYTSLTVVYLDTQWSIV